MISSDTSSSSDDSNQSLIERTLIEAAVTGAALHFTAQDAQLDDPARGANWDIERKVPADLLIELLTGRRRPDVVPRAIFLHGARITGCLDLRHASLICPLMLRDCYVDEPVDLSQATAPVICMPGCHLVTLKARQLRTVGDLVLSGGFTATGGVRLNGAHIGGQLDLNGASLANPSGPALSADELTVEQMMACGEGFYATGEVRLSGAHIAGQLSLTGASLTGSGGPALTASQLTVDQSMTCRGPFTAAGEVRLIGAHIGGQLDLSGASLDNPSGLALNADQLTVDLAMSCADGFTATGEVRLAGAHIGGDLNMSRAKLANPSGRALGASGLTVGKTLTCGDGFAATGEVRLIGAHISGQLDLSGISLSNPDGSALVADQLTVDQDMFCEGGFNGAGEVRLNGARIGGQLDLSGASLASTNRPALNAEQLTVGLSMLCRDGFTAVGEVNLSGTVIGGRLDMTAANLSNPVGTALALEKAEVSVLVLLLQQTPDGTVDLTNAKVGTFYDSRASWPPALGLQGFTYDSLGNHQVSARQRLEWLTRNRHGYIPQVYEQLASTYRRAGDEQAARKIAVAKQRRRRHAYSPLSWLWYLTVGYGYRPWLAGAWVIALAGLGTEVFSQARMVPTSQHPPAFHAAAYALDLLLPVIGLGQKIAWQPQGSIYQYWSWAFTGAGWVLTTALVAGLTGILKRN